MPNLYRLTKLILSSVFALSLTACDAGPNNPEWGGEGQGCYPNQTCNDGFSCVAEVCQEASSGSGICGGGDARDCYLEAAKEYYLSDSKDAAGGKFEQACELGSAPACYTLAEIHNMNLGYFSQTRPKRDLELVKKYNLMACDLGHSMACYEAAKLQETSSGEMDWAKAYELRLKSCEMGYINGCFRAARQLNERKDPDQTKSATLLWAAKHLVGRDKEDLTIKLGDQNREKERLPIEILLGEHYQAGIGVEKDLSQAASIYHEGCNAGLGSACVKNVLTELEIQNIKQWSSIPPLTYEAKFAHRLEKACQLGSTRGCFLLAESILGRPSEAEEVDRAQKLLKDLCTVRADGPSCKLLSDRQAPAP